MSRVPLICILALVISGCTESTDPSHRWGPSIPFEPPPVVGAPSDAPDAPPTDSSESPSEERPPNPNAEAPANPSRPPVVVQPPPGGEWPPNGEQPPGGWWPPGSEPPARPPGAVRPPGEGSHGRQPGEGSPLRPPTGRPPTAGPPSQPPNRPPVQPPPPPETFPTSPGAGPLDVTAARVVGARGCLDLAKFQGWLLELPDDAVVRQTTTNFVFREPEQTARRMLLEYLSISSFGYSEKAARQYSNEQAKAVQYGCDGLTLEGGETGRTTYKIISSSVARLSMSDGTTEITYRITSPRSLEITRRYPALDFCTDDKTHSVQVTETIRWDTPEAMKNKSEKVEGPFLQNMSRALTSTPETIKGALANQRDGNSVTLSPEQLTALLAAEISVESKRCP